MGVVGFGGGGFGGGGLDGGGVQKMVLLNWNDLCHHHHQSGDRDHHDGVDDDHDENDE